MFLNNIFLNTLSCKMGSVFMLTTALYSTSVLAQQAPSSQQPAQLSDSDRESGWVMHHLDNPQVELPNGLDEADVNQDGYPDYVTNYEAWLAGEGDVRIAFHPGKDHQFESMELAVKQLWVSKNVGTFKNAESACFGDIDGDGLQDVIVAHGNQGGEGEVSGISLVYNPGLDKVLIEEEWIMGGAIPSTESQGHYLFVKTHDVNGDGATDIIVGGRREGSRASDPSQDGGKLAGIKWIMSPAGSVDNRRDLTKWQVFDIDPDWYSGHGFSLADIDNDGDMDIADGNEDWDTPKGEEEVAWFENPGVGTSEQKEPWAKHIIHEGPAFYTKTQLDVGDLNQDGHNDIVMQAEESIYYFKNKGTSPIEWELIKIPKTEAAQWRARPVRIADLNEDGKLDLIGATIHQDGLMPSDKMALFWMEYIGDTPSADNWITHPIKWGAGYDGDNVFGGEKWDQYTFYDVDEDGDLDVIANCEEFHSEVENQRRVFIAVAWFENPQK